MKTILKLLNREEKTIRQADSLSKLLCDYESKTGDHVVLYEFKTRDYFLFSPHLEGVSLLKRDEKVFINDNFVFQKLHSNDETWRGIISHPEGILTIINGKSENKLMLFKDNGEQKNLFTFNGTYENEDHPALLGNLIKINNRIFLNGEEKKEWADKNIHHLVHQLQNDIGMPICYCSEGKLWIKKIDGTYVEICNHDLSSKPPKDYKWFLNKGVIVETDNQIILYFIEKAEYKK